MPISNRAAIYNKIFKVMKRYYKPVVQVPARTVLEHFLYACCLEDVHFDRAEESYEKVRQSFFDWNEVRVTTVTELSEVLKGLSDPPAAAVRLKRALQGVFESCYSFDIESLRKQNIGMSAKLLEKYGANSFAVSYLTQHALAGHSVPKNRGAMHALYIVGAITADEQNKGASPGLERTISKKKGIEFGSLLHQLGVDLMKSPFSPAIRSILLEITPDAKQRFPKRKTKKKVVEETSTAKTKKHGSSKSKKTVKNKQTATPKTKSTATKKKSVAKKKTRTVSSDRRRSKRKPK